MKLSRQALKSLTRIERILEKHLQGEHNQMSHGGGGGAAPDTGGNTSGGIIEGSIVEKGIASAISDVVKENTGRERLVMLDGDGNRISDTTGLGGADPSDDAKHLLLDPKQKIIAIHNHPASKSLSSGDIAVLVEWPGLDRIIACTSDGSSFEASLGEKAPSTSAKMLKTYDKAYSAARESLLRARDRGEVKQQQVDKLVDHAVMQGLSDRGVIKYHAKLSDSYKNEVDAIGPALQSAARAAKTGRIGR